MLVISDAIMRQDLIKNISIDKASLGLKEDNDLSSNIRIFGFSMCLMLELASLQAGGCQEDVMDAGEQVHMLHLSMLEQVRNFISPFKTRVPG